VTATADPDGRDVGLVGPATVVTAYDTPEVIAAGGALWRAGRIVEVGPFAELAARHPDAAHLDAAGGLVLPGLINLHHHFYSSLGRGLDPGRELGDFPTILAELWWRLDRALDADTIRLSAELAAADSIRSGVTTVFDHHASPAVVDGSLELVADAVERAGLSAVLCYEISDRNGPAEALAGLEENLAFAAARADHPTQRGMVGLHASFTVSNATLDAVARHHRPELGCHIHVAEDPVDVEVSRAAFGAGPVERLDQRGLLGDRTLAVHCIHLTPEERRRLADRGGVIVHNPESNANNGVGRLDLDGAAADGCRIGIGTDGMSSAVLGSLRAAFLGVRGGRRDPRAGFSVVPDLLAVNAEIAGRFLDDPRLGRLEPGAPADLCVLDVAPPTELRPRNLFAHLVYGCATTPVRHTVARGRVLLNDHRLTTLDPTALAAEARERTPELWRRFRELPPRVPEWMKRHCDGICVIRV
jgi:putative selenium metabolism protein SsnA